MKLSYSIRGLGRPVAYYPRLAIFFGSLTEAVIICQFGYWEGKQKGEWLYKTAEDLRMETGISYRSQLSARKKLKQKGYLEEKLAGVPPVVHFRVNWAKIDKDYSEFLKKSKLSEENY